jgi:DoxX-like family
VTTVIAVAVIVIFALAGIAKLAAVPPMRAAADHLGFTVAQYRVIGALELAGAAGVAAGPAVPMLGIAAAVGLILLLLGAVVAHLTKRDRPLRILFPAAMAGIVIAYLAALV